MSAQTLTSEDWSVQFAGAAAEGEHSLWYGYMNEVDRGLVASGLCVPSLKTDLFDEARVGHGPLRHLPEPACGVDLSPEVVATARRAREASAT